MSRFIIKIRSVLVSGHPGDRGGAEAEAHDKFFIELVIL